MQTERLIARLTERLEPVRPLPSPGRRALAWAAGALAYLAALVLISSPREDLALRMSDTRFLIEQLAALATGVGAAGVAFASTIPGFRRDVFWLPVGAVVLWLAAVAVGAAQDARLVGQASVWLEADWRCVATILLGAAVPGAVIARMVRRGVALTPHLTAGLSMLAAAALGNLGVCLFHPHSSNLTVLVWHSGTVIGLTLLAGLFGAGLFRRTRPGLV